MVDKVKEAPVSWDACTWEGARRDVLFRGKCLSFREKIMWLEEGARMSMALKKSRESNSR